MSNEQKTSAIDINAHESANTEKENLLRDVLHSYETILQTPSMDYYSLHSQLYPLVRPGLYNAFISKEICNTKYPKTVNFLTYIK